MMAFYNKILNITVVNGFFFSLFINLNAKKIGVKLLFAYEKSMYGIINGVYE